MRSTWLAVVVGLAILGAGSAASASVKVDGGLVQGVHEDGLTVYKGIPFAAPPVGDLRWRAPQPAPEWSGVLEADRFAPGCVPSMGEGPPSGTSEDCLYLNVWTPAVSPGDRVPVLVWIYGGGFNFGATSIPVHDGAKLARRGVVLVTIAYRVGLLGFHAQPELSAESPHHVSGNYGLLDMIAALRWIRGNIAAFGGDPERVTIFGESAGGIAVSMLCASPLAKGLFDGAISQSGGSFGPSSRSPVPGENMRLIGNAEVRGAGLAEAAGVASLEELRALPAEKVVEAGRQLPGMAWPIVDGWVIPGDQHELYEAGQFNDTPILVGYNSDEGLSFTRVRTSEDYVAGVRERYGPFADRLLEAYPVAADTIPKTARDLARDSAFGWHTWVWARLQSARGQGKAYYYYFDQHPEREEGSPEADHGAPHGVDVAYVFENLDGGDRPVTPGDRRVSDAMAAYWSNFAKRGDPNGEGLPAWPAFNDENPVVMYFSGTAHTGPVPSASSLRVLDDYFSWRRTPEGADVAPEAEGVPAPSNIDATGYPRILPDNRVVFRVAAPDASRVRVDLGRTYEMRKGDAGLWTATTARQDPGFHYYSLVLDGVRVSDPASESYFGTGRMSSAIEIPEPGVDFYAVEDVPHGEIRSRRYFSKVTGSWRRLMVYTPPGYDEEPGRRYPALYIQHGGGEDETGWAIQGRTDLILDNLIAADRAEPMLVVMANGNYRGPDRTSRGYTDPAMKAFADELLNAVVPFVEAHYRVIPEARGRALAGLSMGGGQTFFVGLWNKGRFGSLGIFSTGLFGGIGRPPSAGAPQGPFDAEERIPGLLSDAQSFNDALQVLYISVGEQDPRFEATKKVVSDFRSHGLDVEFASFPGGHEWQVWRKSLHDFAQRIFKR